MPSTTKSMPGNTSHTYQWDGLKKHTHLFFPLIPGVGSSYSHQNSMILAQKQTYINGTVCSTNKLQIHCSLGFLNWRHCFLERFFPLYFALFLLLSLTCTFISIQVNGYVCVCLSVYVHMCVCVHISMCMYICAHICVRVCTQCELVCVEGMCSHAHVY